MLQVAIVTDDPGWHGARLSEAFAARGAEARFTSLTGAQLDLGNSPDVSLPGYPDRLPDAVFVRGVPGGSLEQVVSHLNMLHALAALGVPVYNSGRAIERSVDKGLTSLMMRQSGLPTPPTWLTTDRERALEIVRQQSAQGHLLLCKPLFGSQGQGICLLREARDLPASDAVAGAWYLQRFVGDASMPAADWRVFVVNGQAVAAMRRTGQGLLANVAQGGNCQAVLVDGELRRLAEAAVDCLQMNYAGVDLMRDADGRWWLIEVNSVPAWKGLQSVCPLDIAGRLADDLLEQCGDLGECEVAQ